MLSKFKWSSLLGTVCAVSIFSYAVIGFTQSPQASIALTTEPPISQASPLEAEATAYLGSGQYNAPVQLKFQAKDTSGAPLSNARVHVEVMTPPPTPWFTTDFPIVEGTKLLDLVADAPTGEFQMQQVFPIRGNYALKVDVTPMVAGAFAPIAQTLNLSVPESSLKLMYFPILLAMLLAIGFGGGWVIGSRGMVRSGEIAPRRVRLLLSGVTVIAIAALMFFNISAEFATAHEHTAEPIADVFRGDSSGLIQSQGLKLELTGDTQTQVGKLASFQAKLTDSQTNQPISDAIFLIQSIQVENNWVAFSYQGVPNSAGILAWQEQFFDGAPHNIKVNVSPAPNSKRSFQPFQVTRKIDVEGIAPPMNVRLITLGYFTGLLAIGMMMGFGLQRRKLSQI